MGEYSKITPKTLTKKDFWLIYFLILMQYCVFLHGCKNILHGFIIIVISCIFPVLLFFLKIFRKNISTVMINKFFGILGVYSAIITAVLLAYQCGNSILKMIIIFLFVCAIIVIFILSLDLIFGKSLEKMKKHTVGKVVGCSIYAMAGLAGMYISRYLTKIGMNVHFEMILGLFCFVFTMFHSFTMKYRQLLKLENNQHNNF